MVDYDALTPYNLLQCLRNLKENVICSRCWQKESKLIMIGEEFKKLLRRLHNERGIPEFKGISLDTGEEIKLSAYTIFCYDGEKFSRYCWSKVALTNRRLIVRPGTDNSESKLIIKDFRLENPNFVVGLSENIFKFQTGFLNRVSVCYKSLLLNDISDRIVVKDADKWKEEIRHLQEHRRKEYSEQLFKEMPDFSDEILLDPNEDVKLKGVGIVTTNLKAYGWVYLTNKRLITIMLTSGLGGLGFRLEHIIELEKIYSLRVDEEVLQIRFKLHPLKEKYEINWISLEFCNNNIGHWKNEIVRLRDIRIKRIEDY